MDGFSDKELLYFYKEVLLDWEMKPKRHYWIKNLSLQLFIKNNRIRLTPKKWKDHISNDGIPKKHLSGYLTFKEYSKGGQVYSILRRLRNSVAHGNFHKIKIGRYYYTVFKDYDMSGKLTMVAKIPHKKVLGLIDLLKFAER